MQEVFVVRVHTQRMENSIMPDTMHDAYATCYVLSADYEDAVKRILKKLLSDGLYPAEILPTIMKLAINDWHIHSKEQWGLYAGELPDQDEFVQKMNCGEVVYGLFAGY